MNIITNVRMQTPWGAADTIKEVADGIISVSTPGHGGLQVADDLLAKMPDALRNANAYSGKGSCWFEEDVEWALVAAAFPELFKADVCRAAYRTLQGYALRAPRGAYMYEAGRWLMSDEADAFTAKAGFTSMVSVVN